MGMMRRNNGEISFVVLLRSLAGNSRIILPGFHVYAVGSIHCLGDSCYEREGEGERERDTYIHTYRQTDRHT